MIVLFNCQRSPKVSMRTLVPRGIAASSVIKILRGDALKSSLKEL